MTPTALLRLHLQASPYLMHCRAIPNGSTLSIPELRLIVVVDEQYAAQAAPEGWAVYRCHPSMVRTGRAIETIEILAGIRRTAAEPRSLVQHGTPAEGSGP